MIDYAYAGKYTLKVVPAFNVLVKTDAFLEYKGVKGRGGHLHE